MQLQSFPLPQLLPPNNPLDPLPEQQSKRIIIKRQLELPPPSQPHPPPQFVAAKSLMFVPPKFIYIVSYEG